MFDGAIIQKATLYEIGSAIVDTTERTEDFKVRDIPDLIRNDVYNAGYGKGNTDGFANGKAEGLTEGYENGYDKGYDEGYAEGAESGTGGSANPVLYGTQILKERPWTDSTQTELYSRFTNVYGWFYNFHTSQLFQSPIKEIVIYRGNVSIQSATDEYSYITWNSFGWRYISDDPELAINAYSAPDNRHLLLEFREPNEIIFQDFYDRFMLIVDNNADITAFGVGEDVGEELGRQAQYNEFWQGVFAGGVKPYHFTGKAWNDNTFYPTEDIKPIGDAYYLFHLCNISDLAGRLRECGVTLDTSGITNRADNMFAWSDNLTTVPYLDLRNAKYAGGILANMFAYCGKLHTIEGIHLAEDGSQNLGSNIFGVCSSLVNLTIYGIIGTGGINLSYSSKLSEESIKSVISALSTTTSGLSITLSLVAKNSAFSGDDEQTAEQERFEWEHLLGIRNNWTINLV